MNLVKIEEPNTSAKEQKCLGIDFGTTNSVCSIKIDEKVIFIKILINKLLYHQQFVLIRTNRK